MSDTSNATRTLGSVLAGVRITARLKQTDVGDKLGFGEDRISRIENDKSPVHVPLFIDWCKVCEVDPAVVIKSLPGYSFA